VTAPLDLILGVDLGTQGAVALVDRGGDLLAVEDLPVLPDGPRSRPHINAAALADLLRSWQPSRAFVEFVGARPTDSRVGAFSFGMARGATEAVLATLAIPMRTITAPAWKRTIGIPAGADQKSTARAEAVRRWPRHAALFARVRDDGRAEAALIAIAGIAREARGQ
jgi:crossover junction endodeoxyribonuclease RuvC